MITNYKIIKNTLKILNCTINIHVLKIDLLVICQQFAMLSLYLPIYYLISNSFNGKVEWNFFFSYFFGLFSNVWEIRLWRLLRNSDLHIRWENEKCMLGMMIFQRWHFSSGMYITRVQRVKITNSRGKNMVAK